MARQIESPATRSALIIVDVQVDFCPGGALAVPDGDRVVPVLNEWIEGFAEAGLPIAYTLDWHPASHCSFHEQGGPWPAHCVQGTAGAALHPDLKIKGALFRKGAQPRSEAYSGFQACLAEGDSVHPDFTLGQWLKKLSIEQVYVGGLATEVCVRATVLDALEHGFKATLISEGTRGVDLRPRDSTRAVQEMRSRGVRIL